MFKYIIRDVKTEISARDGEFSGRIARKLAIPGLSICNPCLIHRGLDARDKSHIFYVDSISFETNHKLPRRILDKNHIFPDETTQFNPALLQDKPRNTNQEIYIVGLGPAGIFAGLTLANLGYKPTIIERGDPIDRRVAALDLYNTSGILDTESNILFGEGGAGTFSDGKLTTGINNPSIRYVLRKFYEAGAPEDILYMSRPHIGTDLLRIVIGKLREELLRLGVRILYRTRLESINIMNNRIKSIVISGEEQGATHEVPLDALLLATGASARDTYQMLHATGLAMEPKPLSIGIRIEHPQELINISQYGSKYAKLLPPADYKLSTRSAAGRGVYTFCMCPGGEVLSCSNSPGELTTNGCSKRKRNSGFANAAILVDVKTSDFASDSPLAGIEFQRQYERLAFQNGGSNYQAPRLSLAEYLSTASNPVSLSLPAFANTAIKEALPVFATRISGFDSDNALVYATETRSSSPIRILRDSRMSSNIEGIFPSGEGAGYAGGIMSSACDGIDVSLAIARYLD